MAIVIGSTTTGEATGTSLTLSSIVVNSGDVLVVQVGYNSNAISTVKWNTSENFTRIITAKTSNVEAVDLWYLSNPTATTASVVITKSAGSDGWAAGATPIAGVTTVAQPAFKKGTTGTSTTASVVVVATSNNCYVFDTADAESTLTVGANQTQMYNQGQQSFEQEAGSWETAATSGSSVTMSWTLASGQRWAIAAMILEAADEVLTTTSTTTSTSTSTSTSTTTTTTIPIPFFVEGIDN